DDPVRDRGLIDVAIAIADDVLLVSVIAVGDQAPLASAQPEARTRRRALDALVESANASDRVRVLVTVARRGWQAIVDAVKKERPDLLVVGWRRTGSDLLGTSVDEILRDPPCDVAIVKGSFIRARHLLVPVRGGRYAQLAVRVALAFARSRQGRVTLLHVMAERTDGRWRGALYGAVGGPAYDERIDQVLGRAGDPVTVIAEELAMHDAIVIGATGREGSPDPLGPVGQNVIRSGRPAIIVRTKTPVASSIFLPRTELPVDRAERSRAIGEIVDKWFVENTFSSTEFADLRRLLEAKMRQRLRISVGLPTLNEETTIGHVIRAVRSRLVERFPIIDELVIIDSGSDDRTREIGRAEGVPVFVHQEVLPELGTYRGKGEALWKSLHVLTGDIVTWIDTDISNIHPKFVYGILGPLLMRPDIAFVKAFYRRPLRMGGELQATGGGRVTELAARPVLNLFFPELSGMVQPLSGEQGGRRSLLEQLPFFTGYGVETGLLIDTLQRAGLSAIAQVDMRQRIHRNQTLYALSKMSFEILQVALKRVGEARGERLWEEANSTMKLISDDDGGQFHLELQDITAIERPPMLTVLAYAEARAKLA
ncbi:MAG: glucosyl-3-phosphoglycerate synthase, partial [Chloroflexota bacterium]|nr:glucosyl-3-phosphoglycerate synthase [Chloroflexota bacterium]